jgi:alpha-ketoglutarate-dependent 2,4-dichlorophenoxyacetate dioxygenase
VQGNSLFHVDSSFNPRRAGFSLLRAHELPPRGLGGNTDFADTRTAFAELPPALKKELEDTDYIAQHNLWHSRQKASPEFFKDVKPDDFPSGRHHLIQRHERSGRMNLYVANHIRKIEGLEPERNQELIDKLLAHATQDKYVISVEWENNGDLVIWDNTAVMHRAHGGEYEGKFKRDMRRATVHDDSVHAWGLNEKSEKRMGLP